MAFPWAAAIGAAGSVVTGLMQKGAARREADRLRYESNRAYETAMNLSEPYREAGARGLKGYSAMADYLGGKLGKKSELIGAASAANVGRINRAYDRTGAAQRSWWKGGGDANRAFGWMLRNEESRVGALNEQALTGAGQQEAYMGQNLNAYGGLLGQLTGAGGYGLQAAMGAIGRNQSGQAAASQVNLQATQGFYDDLGALFGVPIGMYQSRQDAELMADIEKAHSMPQTGGLPRMTATDYMNEWRARQASLEKKQKPR
jgi:hypothetical protein